MNIQAIIESGDLELYVLGALPDAEVRKIASLAATHPDLRQEIEAIEKALMSYAEAQAPNGPSDQVLTGALAQIEEEEKAAPGSSEGLVVPMNQRGSAAGRFQPIWAWAAAVALLIVSGISNFLLYGDLNESQSQLLALQQENLEIAQNLNQASFQLGEVKEKMAFLERPGIKRIELGGVPGHEDDNVVVYWQPTEAKVLLTAAKLPEAPTGFQYQLWAIVDGQPVDAGLLEGLDNWQKMKAISGEAAAFAITLEPAGGSVGPTLDQMVVIGYVG